MSHPESSELHRMPSSRCGSAASVLHAFALRPLLLCSAIPREVQKSRTRTPEESHETSVVPSPSLGLLHTTHESMSHPESSELHRMPSSGCGSEASVLHVFALPP